MRLKGTKYEKIEKLPDGAVTCREYAEKNELGSGAYVQVKYDRFPRKPAIHSPFKSQNTLKTNDQWQHGAPTYYSSYELAIDCCFS